MNVDWEKIHKIDCLMCVFVILFASSEIVATFAVGKAIGYDPPHAAVVVSIMIVVGAGILALLRRGEVLRSRSSGTEEGETA